MSHDTQKLILLTLILFNVLISIFTDDERTGRRALTAAVAILASLMCTLL